ncbi:MAG: hypothetical protein LKG24_06235 [Lacticaseibacillus songhuajiangensis]|jgi:hypothetical protein|nr:hypothetical protein [Lacticaseibacillus songhuajiangensis]
MLEVTAALVVVTGMLLLGIVVGKRYVQTQREELFLDRVQTEWSALQERSRLNLTAGGLQFMEKQRFAHFEEKYKNGWRGNDVPMPETIYLPSHNPSTRIEQASGGKMFASPGKISLNSTLGYHYELTFEMGWGRLIIKKVAGVAG